MPLQADNFKANYGTVTDNLKENFETVICKKENYKNVILSENCATELSCGWIKHTVLVDNKNFRNLSICLHCLSAFLCQREMFECFGADPDSSSTIIWTQWQGKEPLPDIGSLTLYFP